MERRRITTYGEAVDYINEIPRFTKKHSMEETCAFLHLMGDPDLGMSIIHVAGTNGKGSTCAYLRAILEAAGKRVGVFTSPHLLDIRERFLIAGRMPSREEFLDAFLAVYERLEGEYHPTYFEYLFFMCMQMFAGQKLDYVILETGLGGRLDATNSVAGKKLTVITRISLDHVEYLGDTVEKIAGEKAGIMRPGTPLVYSDVEEAASRVFREKARALGITAVGVTDRDYTNLKITNKTIDFLCRYHYDRNIHLSLPTIAVYQAENATLAVRAAEVLEEQEGGSLQVTAEQIRQGVAGCFWPGRMEEVLPGFYVDGAHNEDGIRAFLATVREDGCEEEGRRLIFAVAADKDYCRMLEEIVESGLFYEISIVHMRSARAASLSLLHEVMDRYPAVRCLFFDEVREALFSVLEKRGRERIYAAGSLYLVGEIKELLEHDKF